MHVAFEEQKMPNNCVGCRICEVSCSFAREGVFSPRLSRIKVVRNEELGIDIPITCTQCTKPKCVEACIIEAIKRDEKTGAVVIDMDACYGCNLCIEACPTGAVHLDWKRRKAIKCDLCGGDPKCVRDCPTKVLKLSTVEVISPGKRELIAGNFAKKRLKEWGLLPNPQIDVKIEKELR